MKKDDKTVFENVIQRVNNTLYGGVRHKLDNTPISRKESHFTLMKMENAHRFLFRENVNVVFSFETERVD